MAKKKDLCMRCNIYQEQCDGSNLFIPKKITATAINGTVSCKNLTQTAENTKSPLQVKAFYSLYAAKRRGGMGVEQAFADAIIQTSDDVFKEVKKNKPELIAQYEKGRK